MRIHLLRLDFLRSPLDALGNVASASSPSHASPAASPKVSEEQAEAETPTTIGTF